MCGIIGYTGKNNAKDIILQGLSALEYRGYDSAGLCIRSTEGGFRTVKCGGRVSELAAKAAGVDLSGVCGIGHTRWATHGAPTEANAHPHASDSLVLVHNGIIDNCLELRKTLSSEGYIFLSETDTEAVAHLIDREYKKYGDPARAISSASSQLVGSFALAIMFSDLPGEIWAIRRDNPLIVAMAEDGSYLASDIPAILGHSRDVFRPGENEVVRLRSDGVTVIRPDGKEVPAEPVRVDWNVGAADKEEYAHFMLKEIHEQPDAIRRSASHRINADGLPDFTVDGIEPSFWTEFDSIAIISCGSATHAGLVGRHLIENLAGIPVTVNTASEYRYDPPAPYGRTLALAISQSGETADTLAGLRLAKSMGLRSAAIINVFGSAIATEAEHVMYTNAGPEIAVATTKGYSTQVTILALMAAQIALARNKMTTEQAIKFCRDLTNVVPAAISAILSRRDEIRSLAEKIYAHDDLYYIGRGLDCPAGTECSLKLKEISYIHSEAYAAGELKHGTLSLVEEGTPVVALATDCRYYDKMAGNIREVRARGGYLLLVCGPDFSDPAEFSDDSFILPAVPPAFAPLVSVAFSQILAYEAALMRGCDVDHPRNLAKSVTVE